MLYPHRDADLAVFSDAMLATLPRQQVTAVWSRVEILALWRHLHNDNPPLSYAMGFCKDGERHYRRGKKLKAENAMTWALATVEGKKAPGGELAFVPYPVNAQQQSRWGAMDFDDHDGNAARAERLAFAAFRFFLPRRYGLILETSGSGGWHLWIISPTFQPTGVWSRLLKTASQSIGAAIRSGECELFPPEALTPTRFGKGMRAPGCWNPKTGTFSQIVWQDAADLFPYIRETEGHFPSTGFPKEKKTSLSPSFSPQAELYRPWRQQWAMEFAIDRPATRHALLAGLTGVMFHQVGREMSERIARAQFAAKTVVTRASLTEHLRELAKLWGGLEAHWRETLTERETAAAAGLGTENERDAFRIIRSFHGLACKNGGEDFPIGCDNLAARLGITPQGAGQLRQRFVAIGILRPTCPYQPHKAAARYAWNLADASDGLH